VDLASYSLEGETRPTTEGLSSLGRSVKLGRYGPGPPWRLFLKLPPRKVPARLDTQQLTTGMVWIEGIAIAIPCRFFFVVKKEGGVPLFQKGINLRLFPESLSSTTSTDGTQSHLENLSIYLSNRFSKAKHFRI
jgi:hypothetical protein